MNKSMFIYVISGRGFSKVGISKNPDKRLGFLQNSNPTPLRLRFTQEVNDADARSIEGYAHRLLIELGAKGHGEWFRVPWEVAGRAIMQAQKIVGTKTGTVACSLSVADHVAILAKVLQNNKNGGGDRIRTCDTA